MSVMSPVSAVTSGRSFSLLSDLGVGQLEVQSVIDDPIKRSVVAAAYRGEIEAASIEPADWIAREMTVSDEFVKLGLEEFSRDQVSFASKGVVGPNARFIPGGLTLEILFLILYEWNKVEENPKVKLYRTPNEEWWHRDRTVESIPTEAGTLVCDFRQAMTPTDMAGRPFSLNMDEQTAWSKEQGSSGLTSAEQLIYLFIRSVVERQLPLWANGYARCRNACGSDYSLGVDWCTGGGFGVSYWGRSSRDWCLGAVPEVFMALGA